MARYLIIFVFILCLMQAHALCVTGANNTINGIEEKEIIESEAGNWIGIDVSIVGKYAEKYGYAPRDPYINTDQGDLLLFVFTFFGLISGIIIGYNFRKLFIEGKDSKNSGI